MVLPIVGAVICAILVGVFICLRVKKGGVPGLLSKTLASFGFVTLGLLLATNKATFGTNNDLSAILICCGLVCGLIGDIVLDLKVIYPEEQDKYLPAGMVAFGIGHFFYLGAVSLAISAEMSVAGWDFIWRCLLVVGISLVLTVLTWLSSTKLMKLDFGKHLWITLAYTFILTCVVVFMIVFALSISTLKLWILVVGAILFLLSDLVLSVQYFGGKQADKTMIVINHILYYCAQIVIALFIFTL